ncbi:hypothetical protein MRB56_12605 [Halomonas cupida]|uniref:hypothetical protein n=1 Tax=Halomonas cupida TaxID=44933 RepID=UPI0039B57175
MAFGLQVKNADSDVVIDDTHPVYSLVQSRTFSLASGWRNAKTNSSKEVHRYLAETAITLPTGGAPYVAVFLSPRNGTEVGIVGYENEPANKRVRISLVSENGGAVRLEVYAAGNYVPGYHGQWGMQVFNAQAVKVFDSRTPLLSPERFVSLDFNIARAAQNGYSPLGVDLGSLARGLSGQDDVNLYRATKFLRWQSGRLATRTQEYSIASNSTDMGGAPAPIREYYTYSSYSGGVSVGNVVINNQYLSLTIDQPL